MPSDNRHTTVRGRDSLAKERPLYDFGANRHVMYIHIIHIYMYMYMYVYVCIQCMYDVSICYQIIIRLGEEIAATDGAEHVLNGACDLHRSISIYKKRALKT